MCDEYILTKKVDVSPKDVADKLKDFKKIMPDLFQLAMSREH
jgi:hypothetical protein